MQTLFGNYLGNISYKLVQDIFYVKFSPVLPCQTSRNYFVRLINVMRLMMYKIRPVFFDNCWNSQWPERVFNIFPMIFSLKQLSLQIVMSPTIVFRITKKLKYSKCKLPKYGSIVFWNTLYIYLISPLELSDPMPSFMILWYKDSFKS